jgi:pSer/pThr/pTyr-binding forkhead associated (FHA) protein
MKLSLIELALSSRPRRVEIDHFPFILGRSSSCDFQVVHPMVSRKHCELVPADDGVKVLDLHSSNGTYVNGHRVWETEVVHDGDEIHLACVSYRVAVDPSSN